MANFRFSPGTGGVISIVPFAEMALQVGPCRKSLKVDLSASLFEATDTYDPVRDLTFNAAYRPAVHRLNYAWDTGDTDIFQSPKNLPFGWNSKSWRSGAELQKVWGPGTHTVRVYVWDDEGRTAYATYTFKIDDPTDGYDHIVGVNPSGDADFSWMPSGGTATYHTETLAPGNVFDDSVSAYTNHRSKDNCLWLLKPGGTYNDFEFVSGGTSHGAHQAIGSYGYTFGTRPICNKKANHAKPVNINRQGETSANDIRIYGLDLRGTFDPTTQDPFIVNTDDPENPFEVQSDHHCIQQVQASDIVLYESKISGFGAGYVNAQGGDGSRFIMSDVECTQGGGHYAILAAGNDDPDGVFASEGCYIHDDPLTIAYEPPIRRRARFRINSVAHETHASNDVFYVTRGLQPAYKTIYYHDYPGGVMIMDRCVTEGGGDGLFQTHANSKGPLEGGPGAPTMNGVIESGIYIAGPFTRNIGSVHGQGLTVRNTYTYVPAFTGANANSPTSIPFGGMFDASSSRPHMASSGDGGVEFYNNTCVNLRTSVQNGGEADCPVYRGSVSSAYPYIDEANNLIHAPNITNPVTGSAPFVSAVVAAVVGNVKARTTCSVVGVKDILTDPAPVDPLYDNSQFLVASSGATGDFAGHENEIAHWNGSVWAFTTPVTGEVVYDYTGAQRLGWNGSTWVTHDGSFENAYNSAGDILIYTPDTGSSAIDGAVGAYQAAQNLVRGIRPAARNIGAIDDTTSNPFAEM